jgi:hypothetical protein
MVIERFKKRYAKTMYFHLPFSPAPESFAIVHTMPLCLESCLFVALARPAGPGAQGTLPSEPPTTQ